MDSDSCYLGTFSTFTARSMSTIIFSGERDIQDFSSITLTNIFEEDCQFPGLSYLKVFNATDHRVKYPDFIRIEGQNLIVESSDIRDAGRYTAQVTIRSG